MSQRCRSPSRCQDPPCHGVSANLPRSLSRRRTRTAAARPVRHLGFVSSCRTSGQLRLFPDATFYHRKRVRRRDAISKMHRSFRPWVPEVAFLMSSRSVSSMLGEFLAFSTFKRDGIELPASFTATVNGEMKVGGVEETLTVTGEAPQVDVQTTSQQVQLGRTFLEATPT